MTSSTASDILYIENLTFSSDEQDFLLFDFESNVFKYLLRAGIFIAVRDIENDTREDDKFLSKKERYIYNT